MPTNNDGLPDGTVIVPQPATCPELADVYNAPLCAFDHELVYIPMQVTILSETGGEVLWVALIVGWVLLSIGAALILGRYLGGPKKSDPARAEDDRA